MRFVDRDGNPLDTDDWSEYQNKDKQRQTGDYSQNRPQKEREAMREADDAPLDDTVVLAVPSHGGGGHAYHEAEIVAQDSCRAAVSTDYHEEIERAEAKQRNGLFPCGHPGCRNYREERAAAAQGSAVDHAGLHGGGGEQ